MQGQPCRFDAPLQPVAQARQQRVHVTERQVHRVDRQLELVERIAQGLCHEFRLGVAPFELAHRGGDVGADAVVHVAQDAAALGGGGAVALDLGQLLKRGLQFSLALCQALREFPMGIREALLAARIVARDQPAQG